MLKLVFGWKAYAIGAAAALVAFAVYTGAIKRKAYNAGYDAALTLIERANAAANRKATDGEAAVIECHRAGKTWDRGAMKCKD